MLIVTAASEEFQPISDITIPNKRAYAKKWSIGFWHRDYEDTTDCWERIGHMQEGVTRSDWMIWMGGDTIFTNFNIPPDAFVDNDQDIVFAVDENGLQSDVMFLKNSPLVHEFLGRVMERKGNDRCEQDAMSVVLSGCKDYIQYRTMFHELEKKFHPRLAHEILLNQPGKAVVRICTDTINKTIGSWAPGDYIFHAADATGGIEKRAATLRMMSDYR